MRNDWHVGVVIPAKNEQDFIEEVIHSIPDFVDKIVVVNDGSNDETQAIVEKNISTNDKIRLVNTDWKRCWICHRYWTSRDNEIIGQTIR